MPAEQHVCLECQFERGCITGGHKQRVFDVRFAIIASVPEEIRANLSNWGRHGAPEYAESN